MADFEQDKYNIAQYYPHIPPEILQVLPMLIAGSGGLSQTQYGNIINGGGALGMQLPQTQTPLGALSLMLNLGGGGAYGNLKGKDWKEKVRDTDYGFGISANLNY